MKLCNTPLSPDILNAYVVIRSKNTFKLLPFTREWFDGLNTFFVIYNMSLKYIRKNTEKYIIENNETDLITSFIVRLSMVTVL